MDTSGRAVLFAGATVVIALLGMFALGVSFLYGPAVASSLAVLLAMTASLTAAAGDAEQDRPPRGRPLARCPGFGRRASADGRRASGTAGAGLIQRRPVAGGDRLGRAAHRAGHPGVLDRARLGRRRHRPTSAPRPGAPTTCWPRASGTGFNGPLQIVAELPRHGDVAGLPALRAARRTPARVSCGSRRARVNPAGNTALLLAYPTHVAAEREDQGPGRPDCAPTPSRPIARATGRSAPTSAAPRRIFEDFAAYLNSKLPLFIGIVVALSALLLMVVFRSVLVPLKAVAMNLLSIGASLRRRGGDLPVGLAGRRHRRRPHAHRSRRSCRSWSSRSSSACRWTTRCS